MPGLPPVYVELRDRIRIHLKQIRKSQKKHPEYAVALLIAVASEALSKLRNRKRWYVFAKELLAKPPHEVSEAVGRGIFLAVRHGLAHRYDTALVEIGRQKLIIVIAWKLPAMHLKVRERDWLHDRIQRPGLYLDMETMWTNLETYFKKFTKALQRDERLARQVVRQGQRLDEKYSVKAKGEPLVAWQKFLKERAPAIQAASPMIGTRSHHPSR
jgi:hypothetical protein